MCILISHIYLFIYYHRTGGCFDNVTAIMLLTVLRPVSNVFFYFFPFSHWVHYIVGDIWLPVSGAGNEWVTLDSATFLFAHVKRNEKVQEAIFKHHRRRTTGRNTGQGWETSSRIAITVVKCHNKSGVVLLLSLKRAVLGVRKRILEPIGSLELLLTFCKWLKTDPADLGNIFCAVCQFISTKHEV